jgi:hypothetical protein
LRFFILRKAEASKQGVQRQKWQLAVQGYNLSCQHSCGGRPSTVSSKKLDAGALAKGKGFTPL